MPNYDTRVEIGESGDVCKEIADSYGQELRRLLELTKETGEEYGVVFWKINGNIKFTATAEGESSIVEQKVAASAIKGLRSEAAEMEGIDDANEFYKESDWLAVVHTHPGGDPSPSAGDILATLSHMKDIRKIEGKNSHYISSMPVPTAMLAVAEADNGDVIITGLRVPDDIPSNMEINAYMDEAKSLKASLIPRFFDSDEEKERWMKNMEERYGKLIGDITGSGRYGKVILKMCHATIERGRH